MKTCIDVAVKDFLEKPQELMELYRRSHVDQVQLYVGGIPGVASLADTARAREILIQAGFDTAAIAVPVGHPAVVAGEPTRGEIALHSRPGWRFRTGRNGQPEYFSHELTDQMISDTLAYVKDFSGLGFDLFFMDDDLRSCNLQEAVGGCFCPECRAEFARRTGYASLDTPDALRAWTVFQSERVTRLMRGMREFVAHPGIMIMIHGDERHGVAPRELAKIDGLHVRVGEEHFFDHSARTLQGRGEEYMAVVSHLYRLPEVEETYSESTAVEPGPGLPYPLTSPEHMYSKAILALTAGVKNIDWMCHKHWDMMEIRDDDLRTFARAAEGRRAWPAHVARASQVAGQGLYPDLTATMAGLPAAGVFAEEALGGDMLVIEDELLKAPEWRKAAEKYRAVLSPKDDLKAAAKKLDVPCLERGRAFVGWIPEKNRAVLYNPLETEQRVTLFDQEIVLPAGEGGWADKK